jgi:hypothetical protein
MLGLWLVYELDRANISMLVPRGLVRFQALEIDFQLIQLAHKAAPGARGERNARNNQRFQLQ